MANHKKVIAFENAGRSVFLVNAGLTVGQMQDVAAVVEKLPQLPEWKTRYRVVSAVYVGQQCTIVSSKGAKSARHHNVQLGRCVEIAAFSIFSQF